MRSGRLALNKFRLTLLIVALIGVLFGFYTYVKLRRKELQRTEDEVRTRDEKIRNLANQLEEHKISLEAFKAEASSRFDSIQKQLPTLPPTTPPAPTPWKPKVYTIEELYSLCKKGHPATEGAAKYSIPTSKPSNWEPISFVTVMSDEGTLIHNLLASPVFIQEMKNEAPPNKRHQWIVINVANELNANLPNYYLYAQQNLVKNDLMAYLHSDVYMPPDWETNFFANLSKLESHDKKWGVIGMAGQWNRTIRSYCADNKSKELEMFRQVYSIDEAVIVFRKNNSDKIVWDPKIGGHHLFGTDIVLQASFHKLKSYVTRTIWHHKERVSSGRFPTGSDKNKWLGYFYAAPKHIKTVVAPYLFSKWRGKGVLPVGTGFVLISEAGVSEQKLD